MVNKKRLNLLILFAAIAIIFSPAASYAFSVNAVDENSDVTVNLSGNGTLNENSVEKTALDGTHYFDKFQRTAATFYKKAPLTKSAMATRGKLGADNSTLPDTVGEVQNFWTRNTGTNQNEQIPATCARVGKNCYIYVANNVRVDETYLDRLLKEFDGTIYPVNTSNFGFEWKPGVDNDNHITLFLLDIKDGMENSGAYVAGYFFAGDEYSKSQYQYSNEREMIYLDVIQGAFSDDKGFKRFCGTIAHEFQHMIHWHYDAKEFTWVNEAMSQYASFINGYGHPGQVSAFFKMPDTSLVAWRNDRGLQNYGVIYMFSYYLIRDVVGIFTQNDTNKQLSFIKALVANPEHGIAGISSTLKAFGINKNFTDIYLDWLTANAINNPKVSRRFGYDQYITNYLPLARRVHGTFPVTGAVGTLDVYGGLYIVMSIDPEYLKMANNGAQAPIGGVQNGGYVMRISLARTNDNGGNQLVGRLLKVKFDDTYSGDDFIIGPDNNYTFTVPGFPSEFKTLIFTFGAVSSEQLAFSRPTYNFRYDFVPVASNVRYMVSAYNQLVSDSALSQINRESLMKQTADGIMASISTGEGAADFLSEMQKLDPAKRSDYTGLINDIKKKANFDAVRSDNSSSNGDLMKTIELIEKSGRR